MTMRWSIHSAVSLAAAAMVLLASCGEEKSADEPAAADSGVSGVVHLGPQCPVETVDDPCDDKPAANVTVTVSEQPPGESYAAGKEVAQGTTDAAGAFHIDVAPGEYVVTADAGMSCELMDARVVEGEYAAVDVPCDTGIR
jgi:hypothetical protein